MEKTVFELIQMYLNKEPMPQRVKYELMQKGYEYFRWDDDAEEYICEGDETCILSNTPWHHYMDEVEIVDEPQTDCIECPDIGEYLECYDRTKYKECPRRKGEII